MVAHIWVLSPTVLGGAGMRDEKGKFRRHRKIIQIAEATEGRFNEVGGYIDCHTTALCNDGSLWTLGVEHDESGKSFHVWFRLPDIPQEVSA